MNENVDNCHACSTPLIPDAAYCHRCGSPVLLPAAEEAAPVTPDAEDLHQPSIAPGTLWSTPTAGGGPSEPTPAAGAVPPTPDGSFPPPPAPPPSPAPDDGLARALGGGYSIRMGEWLSRGWSVFTREGGLFLAFAAIGWVFWMVTCVFVHLAWPVLLLAMPLLSAGFMTAALIARRGERLQFSDFGLPFQDFLALLLANLVSWALLLAGLCTCGIVTIYLWVGYQFAYLLILDRGLDFWDALECSRRVATRQWFGIFAFSLILFLINLAGVAMCGVGIIVTFPLTVCALVEAYADIFGVRGGLRGRRSPALPAAAPAPQPPPIA